MWGPWRTISTSLFCLAYGLLGCDGPAHVVIDGDADSDSDGDIDDVRHIELTPARLTKVDLLFVIDNSNTMLEEQGILHDQIVVMVSELLTPIDEGIETPSPVDDLHIAVVTSDIGVGSYTFGPCTRLGDDGLFQNLGNIEGCQPFYSSPDCERAECAWLSHSDELPDDGSDPENPPIWEDFGCIATVGTDGCAFEQPLEASLRALTTQAAPGMPNDGFLRNDSILAIVYITDEDDCSTPNDELFNPARDDFGPLNIRCALWAEELYPIDRYIDGFLNLRHGDEDRIVVASISGIPLDGSWSPGDPLDRLRELQQVNPENPNYLLPSCNTPMGLAFPPVRLAELVYGFGSNGIIESICRNDWTSALQRITRSIGTSLVPDCLPMELDEADRGRCRVLETLIDDSPCPHPIDGTGSGRSENWQVDMGLNESGHRICETLPADFDGDGCPDGITASQCEARDYGPTTGAIQGWFFSDSESVCEHGQILFTSPIIVNESSQVILECRN